MKKLTILLLATLFSYTVASAEVGLRIGASGMVGLFEASGQEADGTEITKTGASGDKNEMLVGMGSIFVEKQLGFLPGPFKRLSIGYDHVLHEIKTGVRSNLRQDMRGDAIAQTVVNQDLNIFESTNKASATIDNINTMYVTANITDWLYLKYGVQEMDVKTTEDLDTGSSYGNLSIDGTVMGLGITAQNDMGLGFKFEWNQTDLDGGSLVSTTNTDNKITLDSVEGDSYKLSVYKAF